MKSKLVKGAFFVTFASLLVKLLSIVYKIPYQNVMGDKGFYVFQQMYPFYALFISMATFAFPLSISERLNTSGNPKKVISSIFSILFLIGVIFILIILVFNPFLGFIFNDFNLSPLFYPIIPVILLIPVISVVRGYLYADPNLINKVGHSQVLEQIFRVGFILYIVYQYKIHVLNDPYDVAKLSLYGFGIGIFIATVYLMLNMDYRLISIRYVNLSSGLSVLRRGLFLLIGSSVLIILQLVDSLTIIKMLSKTIELKEAMIIKGIYDRSLPLIQTALFFVSPLISSFLPHIKSKEEYGKLVTLIVMLALPATLGMFFITEDLNTLLFKDQQLSRTLQINTLIIFLYAIFLTLSSLIKDSRKITSIILFGILIKYFMNLFLIEQFGINGAPISSIISLFLIIFLILLITQIEIKINHITIIKIFIGSFFMFAILNIVNYFITINHLIINIGIGVISYFGLLILLKVTKEDLLIK